MTDDTDLEMFMVKLRSLLSNENNPFIEARKPEIQLLYEELGYLIGSCFKDTTIEEKQLHDDVGNWKRRLIQAAQEAEDSVDMLLSSAILKFDYVDSLLDDDHEGEDSVDSSLDDDHEAPPHEGELDDDHETRLQFFIDNMVDCSLKILKGVMDELKSMREEMPNETGNLDKQEMMMMDNKFESTGGNLSPTKHEEFIVGFDDDALSIIDSLTGYHKKLDIFSIVGMGGLGKTTLATKIFNDSYVKYCFDIRGWITVSQAYSKRDMLLQLLVSIGKSVDEAANESKLYEMLYKSLKGKRYLIVIDDIWSSEAWNEVRICFPDDNTGSRVLVTTRLTEVACHISRGGFTHNLGHLTEHQSWDLLCRKTFRGNECPKSLIETGKHIAKKCEGLPLALVVIAGVLEKGEKRKDVWENIAKSVGSYIINDPKGCLDTLALSYDHLPSHLKKCFLYVGGFPEDYKIKAETLIRLWMAEGFIKEAGERSLEEEAEYYFMDLIDRNLLIVADKRSDGGIKSCRLHDLLREVCLKKADEESFFKKISIQFSDNIVKQRRLFTDYEVLCKIRSHDFSTQTRSVLCFNNNGRFGFSTTKWIFSFLLLRVLDLLSVYITKDRKLRMLRMLVHLRYLAVCIEPDMPVDCNLSSKIKTDFGSLQTLIVVGQFRWFIYLPHDFGVMVNLRHLRCSDTIYFPRDFGGYKLLHLQTLSRLVLYDSAEILHEYFPNIKKLGCSIFPTASKNGSVSFALLSHLEALRIEIGEGYRFGPLPLPKSIRFPEALKKLTLKGLNLPWNFMSIIQRLPKLEVLKLLESSFTGELWETGDEQFQQLKYLKLEELDIRFWEASSINFPHLRKLVVRNCGCLEEVPLDLGNLFTLEHIETDNTNTRVVESVNRIQEAQRELGNCDIHVTIIPEWWTRPVMSELIGKLLV